MRQFASWEVTFRQEWQEKFKLEGFERGDSDCEGDGEYPGAIEWSGKGRFYGERVEVVLNEEELDIWWKRRSFAACRYRD